MLGFVRKVGARRLDKAKINEKAESTGVNEHFKAIFNAVLSSAGSFRTKLKEVIMPKGSVFQSNRSQAIRLPKVAALPEDVKRVDVIAIGRTRIITPVGESWDSWFDDVGVTGDFMAVRDQPDEQERESF
ncbi:hypothetical protein GCM10008094_23330 [Aidingimonas halophila]|nr:hypothetical protein GCM10008094_23330 [Aidingimonas halophila]